MLFTVYVYTKSFLTHTVLYVASKSQWYLCGVK